MTEDISDYSAAIPTFAISLGPFCKEISNGLTGAFAELTFLIVVFVSTVAPAFGDAVS